MSAGIGADTVDHTLALPFLVVTPLGLGRAAALAEALLACDVVVQHRCTVRPWSRAASCLYARSFDGAAQALARRFEARWLSAFPADRAERWLLAGAAAHARLVARKAALRARFPDLPLDSTGAGRSRLHAFHVPDVEDLRAEATRLAPFCTD